MYGDLIPKQARWETEIVLTELIHRREVDEFLGDIEDIEAYIEKIAAVFVDFEGILDRERDEVGAS